MSRIGRPRTWPAAHRRSESVDLLARIASDDTVAFERMVLLQAFVLDMGSARQISAVDRLQELGVVGEATFQSKTGEGAMIWNAGAAAAGFYGGERAQWPNPSWEHIEEFLDATLVVNQRCLEASDLAVSKMQKNYALLLPFHHLGFVPVLSHLRKWDFELYGGERTLVAIIDEYDYHVDGPVHKDAGLRSDMFRSGVYLPILVLHFGNLDSLRV